MALNANSLSSISSIESFLGIAQGTDTALLELMIDTASSNIESIVGRKLKNRTYTDFRLDGNGERWILFPEYPLNTVTSLVIEDSLQSTVKTIDTNLANKKMLIDSDVGRIILMEDVFITGLQNIKITATAGLLSSNTPDALQLRLIETAVNIMVQSLYVNKGLADQFLRSEQIGDYRYTRFAQDMFSALPAQLQTAILSLKRI